MACPGVSMWPSPPGPVAISAPRRHVHGGRISETCSGKLRGMAGARGPRRWLPAGGCQARRPRARAASRGPRALAPGRRGLAHGGPAELLGGRVAAHAVPPAGRLRQGRPPWASARTGHRLQDPARRPASALPSERRPRRRDRGGDGAGTSTRLPPPPGDAPASGRTPAASGVFFTRGAPASRGGPARHLCQRRSESSGTVGRPAAVTSHKARGAVVGLETSLCRLTRSCFLSGAWFSVAG